MTTLTEKCQVTIPKQFRAAFGLKPGDEVEFGMGKSQITIRKKVKSIPFEKWRGCLGNLYTDKLMEELGR